MKKFSYITLLILFFVGACKQEDIELTPPDNGNPPTPVPGTANFSKFIVIGTSFTAGFQAGALFDEGQANSLGAILNKQFETAGGTAEFNQPDIDSENGFNIFVVPNPAAGPTVLGRFKLQYSGATSPKPTPQISVYPDDLPNLAANPGFQYPGTTSDLNNFSVQATVLGQALIPATGGPPSSNLAYSPFYARFASNPSVNGTTGSTIMSDAATSGGTFVFVWLGMDDFLLHAAFGGDPSKAPLTNSAAFDGQYDVAINAILGVPNMKGVVANFPDIFKMPHFTSVPYNAIVFTAADQATKIDPTNSAYAPYNGGLDVAFANALISAEERDQRKIHFAVGPNGIVMEDESLSDLSGLGLPSIRQATAADIFPLAAGNVLGKEATPGNPATTWGVGKALTDQYALIPDEIDDINEARALFNASVEGAVSDHPDDLALADMEAAFNDLVVSKAKVYNYVTITPNINPPTGIYSEDGIHPNSRGYAYLSHAVINAINAKFGATIPLTNLSLYGATGLPIP